MKPKRLTAKDRAEAYRQSNRDKILKDMKKEKSTIDNLLEKRRQRRCERESQVRDSQTPEKGRTEWELESWNLWIFEQFGLIGL